MPNQQAVPLRFRVRRKEIRFRLIRFRLRTFRQRDFGFGFHTASQTVVELLLHLIGQQRDQPAQQKHSR